MKSSDLLKIVGFYGRFTPTYSRLGYAARKLSWPARDFDFAEQHWLVTGASGGIGAAIVAAAAAGGATVTAVARSEDKLRAARESLDSASAARVSDVTCDLASVAALDGLLERLRAEGRSIDVLVNNVGVLLNEFSSTSEGFETSYVTNLLGHYQLTEGIMDNGLLCRDGLILNMSSGGLYNVPLGTALLNVTDPARYSGKLAYAAHKRAQVALSGHWDDRLQVSGGRSYVMHPGWVRTEGVRQSLPVFYRIQGAILRKPEEGADTAIWLADERPDRGGRAIWFDRAVRPQHVFAHTHTPQCDEQDVFDFLRRDLDAARAGAAAA